MTTYLHIILYDQVVTDANIVVDVSAQRGDGNQLRKFAPTRVSAVLPFTNIR